MYYTFLPIFPPQTILMKMMKPFLTSLSALLLISTSHAQISYFDLTKDRNLMLNIGGGTANYFGDFVNPGTMGIIRPSINVEAEYYWTDLISLRAELGWFQLAGKDSDADDDRWERNLRFKSNALELNTTAAIHLFPQNSTFYPRPKFNPYLFAGMGIMWNNPKTDYNGEMVALQPLRTEDIKYNRIQFVVPTGIGFKVQITPYWNLIAQGGMRWTFTDHLDDVSRERYPNPIVLTSDLARILSDRRGEIGTKPSDPLNVGKRGNPDEKDHYLILNLKAQYYLPVEIFKDWQEQSRQNKANRIERRELRKAMKG